MAMQVQTDNQIDGLEHQRHKTKWQILLTLCYHANLTITMFPNYILDTPLQTFNLLYYDFQIR